MRIATEARHGRARTAALLASPAAVALVFGACATVENPVTGLYLADGGIVPFAGSGGAAGTTAEGGSPPATGGLQNGGGGTPPAGGGVPSTGGTPANNPCAQGEKQCSGLCVLAVAAVGCGNADCSACPNPQDGTAICTGGACDFECDQGFVKGANTTCIVPGLTCGNGVMDGAETDVDCGGDCAACGGGQGCQTDLDCASGPCVNGACDCTPTLSCGPTSCGTLNDLCGPIQCGDCTPPETCGGGGIDNECGSAPPEDNCDPGTFDGHHYWFCGRNHNFNEAVPLCESVGGHLLVIETAEEQAFVEQNIDSAAEWVIGLNQANRSGQNTSGEWEWINGVLVSSSFSNWGSGEPDSGDCGAMNRDGTWKDFSCTNDENYICEIE